jgi:hypothetical protein
MDTWLNAKSSKKNARKRIFFLKRRFLAVGEATQSAGN